MDLWYDPVGQPGDEARPKVVYIELLKVARLVLTSKPDVCILLCPMAGTPKKIKFRKSSFAMLPNISTLVFLLAFSALTGWSQTASIDSLRNEIANTESDTMRVKLMADLGEELTRQNSDSAFHYLSAALALANNIHYKFGQARTLNYMGRHYASTNRFYMALDHFLKCLSIEGYPQQRHAHLITFYDLGQLYGRIGGQSREPEISRKRIMYFKKTLQLLSASASENAEEMKVGIFDELGRAYMMQKPAPEYDSAEIFFNTSIAIAKKVGYTFSIPSTYNELAHLFQMKRDLPRAIGYQHMALRSAKVLGAAIDVTVIYNSMARLHKENRDYDSAFYYIGLSNGGNSLFNPSSAQIQGEIYHARKQYKKAIGVYTALLQDAKEREDNMDFVMNCNNLSECFEKMGDSKNALFYTKLSIEMDSLISKDLYLKMDALQADFDLAQHQSEITLMGKEAAIQALTLRKNKIIQVLIGGLLLITVFVIGIVTYQYRKIIKAKSDQERVFKEVDELKSRFFANISHEFRTPLTLILSPIQKRMAAAGTNEDRMEFMVIEKNARRLLTLVNQLLDLSRIDMRSLKLNLSNENVSALVRLQASQFQSLAVTRGVDFKIEVHENIFAAVDAEKLKTITSNLLSNAFKFTPEGGIIVVQLMYGSKGTRTDSTTIVITVSDNGPGIATEHHDKIFNRFYQVDDSPTRRFEGTGIGLALTRELVELHSGRITVESAEGKGAKFFVVIPVNIPGIQTDDLPSIPVGADQQDQTSPVREPPVIVDSSESILIVEDNADLRGYLRKELQKDYLILEAEDGSRGIDLALEKLPTLIISDLMMPQTDGLQLCDTLKKDERSSHIPIILLTAKADIETKITGYEQGADDYLAKPFDARELASRIRNIIMNRKRLQERYAVNGALRPANISVESMDDRFVKRAMQTIEDHMDDTTFGVAQFADEMAISSVQLYRKLLAITGFSTNDLIRHARLLRANDLLQQKAGNVAEIAYMVGFNNLSYFSKVYKEKFGRSPSDDLKSL